MATFPAYMGGAQGPSAETKTAIKLTRLVDMGAYPGTGAAETNGEKTASVTDSDTQKMVQTMWNLLRTAGLLA